MPRMPRISVPRVPYHLTHRGNRGELVFRAPVDRWSYLSLLEAHARKNELEIWAYCLMTNHIHLIARPAGPDSLARTIAIAHGQYARRFNVRYGLSGHLWANRFYSCPLDEAHLFCAARYVELNPVRAGLATAPEEFAWSSARANLGEGANRLLSPGRPWAIDPKGWRSYLGEAPEGGVEPELRRCTTSGRPAGSREFVETVGHLAGRDVACPRRGRPPSRLRVNRSPAEAALPSCFADEDP